MIRRLYVDNYKCFVNFEYKPRALELLIGENGAGKSAAFEVIERLRAFLGRGSSTGECFKASTLTRWQDSPAQRFELDIAGPDGEYYYELRVEHDAKRAKNRIAEERLKLGNRWLYVFDGKDAHLYRDDGSEGPSFPTDWSRSFIFTLPERDDNKRLTWFRNYVAAIQLFFIDPHRMKTESDGEEPQPLVSLANFASWYRHATQDAPDRQQKVFDSLRDVLAGFRLLKLEQAGEYTRVLKAVFSAPGKPGQREEPLSFRLDELSEGQRCLIALYTVLHFCVQTGRTICFDEPDNYVALRELEPFLAELRLRCEDSGCQCLIISHHPEILDRLTVDHGVRFVRDDMGPTRTKPCTFEESEKQRPSEIVARGWED